MKQGEIVLFGTLGQDLFVEESDDGIGDGLGDGGGLLGLLFGVGGDRFGVVLGGPLVESLFAQAAGNDLRENGYNFNKPTSKCSSRRWPVRKGEQY